MRVARFIWVVLAVTLLAACVGTYNQTSGRDNDIMLAYGMAALGFPSSAGVLAAIGWMTFKLGKELPGGHTGMIGVWSVMFIAGYVQWFVMVPALRTMLVKRRQHASLADDE